VAEEDDWHVCERRLSAKATEIEESASPLSSDVESDQVRHDLRHARHDADFTGSDDDLHSGDTQLRREVRSVIRILVDEEDPSIPVHLTPPMHSAA